METNEILAVLDSFAIRLQELTSQVTNLRIALASSEPVFPEWAKEKVDQRICLVCGEKITPEQRMLRGSHEAHLRRVTRAIDRGQYTEFEAIEKGILAPKTSGGRKPAPIELDPRVMAEGWESLERARIAHEAKHDKPKPADQTKTKKPPKKKP